MSYCKICSQEAGSDGGNRGVRSVLEAGWTDPNFQTAYIYIYV